MSDKRDEFQRWMDEGNNAAWERNWTAAINAYSRAIQVLPEDPDAHVNLGLGLLNAGQLDRALKAFKKANQLAPDDPVPLERTADVLERMGQLKEAAQQYIKVAEAYLAQKDWDKAIGNWERATQLTPGLVSVHARLAQAYERLGDNKQAIREYLTLAFNFRRLNDTEKAIKAVDRALRLESNNAQALNIRRALLSGGDVILPEEMLKRERKVTAEQSSVSGFDPFGLQEEETEAEADPLGPMGEALTQAMSLLAAHVVESGLGPFVGHALQGMEFQRQGLQKEAVNAYIEADKAGLRHPALKMSLGGLLVLTDQPKDALKHLGEAAVHPQLGPGALHGIGQAHFKLGDQRNAVRYLLRSLEAVDTSLAMEATEAAELASVYERINATLEDRNLEALTAINERFISLLSGKDWKTRIAETRRHLTETLREDEQGLVDFLVAKGGDELAESVSSIDRYIKQGLYTLAMDECHRAVEKSPFYLPVHVRMAEVMMKEGRIRQAINKYNMVAKSYRVREEKDRAAAILQTVLDMAPLDVEVRTNLIELLESEENWSEALEQYIDLANTYQQLGDFERANQTFGAAERLSRRINAPANKLIEIKHHLASIHQMRLDTRKAQRTYDEILELDPSDEKALRGLIDIHYTQGNQVEAVKRLDALLSFYAKKGQVTKIRSMLEELVRQMPSDTALRARLASIYRKLNMIKEAIEQLDALGELQLDAGLTKEAATTIRQIIALQPEHVDEYKRLLAQLNA